MEGVLFFTKSIYLFLWLHCTASRTLVPWLGIEPMPTAEEAWSLSHWNSRKVFSLQNFSQLKTDFAHHRQTCIRTHTYPADPKTIVPPVQPQQKEWFSQEKHGDWQHGDEQQQPLDMLLLVQTGRKPVNTQRPTKCHWYPETTDNQVECLSARNVK